MISANDNFQTMGKIDLKGMSKTEFEELAKADGLSEYRGRQMFRWIYQEGIDEFEEMTDLPGKLRRELGEKYEIGRLRLLRRQDSADGSTKFLFGLDSAAAVEAVVIPEDKRLTLCMSSQAGCALGCRFCATGRLGFKRNLSSGEIVDQFLQAQKASVRKITNIVFMGMGEPTLNLKNVLKACEIISDDLGPSLSQKKITVSTVGVIHVLKKFVDRAGKLGLAISLHSADEEKRKNIIPIAEKNSLPDLMAEAKRYTQLSGRRVSFEYLLLGGLTDGIDDARKLVSLIHGIPCKINLMRYNPVPGLPFKRPDESDVQIFKEYLYPRTYAVTIRESRGLDINGACGQLAADSPG